MSSPTQQDCDGACWTCRREQGAGPAKGQWCVEPDRACIPAAQSICGVRHLHDARALPGFRQRHRRPDQSGELWSAPLQSGLGLWVMGYGLRIYESAGCKAPACACIPGTAALGADCSLVSGSGVGAQTTLCHWQSLCVLSGTGCSPDSKAPALRAVLNTGRLADFATRGH